MEEEEEEDDFPPTKTQLPLFYSYSMALGSLNVGGRGGGEEEGGKKPAFLLLPHALPRKVNPREREVLRCLLLLLPPPVRACGNHGDDL